MVPSTTVAVPQALAGDAAPGHTVWEWIDPAGMGSEAFTETVGVAAAAACQSGALGSIGSTSRPVTALGRQVACQGQLLRVACGVGQHHPQAVAAEVCLQAGHELLVPEVGQQRSTTPTSSVRAAADRIGFRSDPIARALRGGRTELVGVVGAASPTSGTSSSSPAYRAASAATGCGWCWPTPQATRRRSWPWHGIWRPSAVTA